MKIGLSVKISLPGSIRRLLQNIWTLTIASLHAKVQSMGVKLAPIKNRGKMKPHCCLIKYIWNLEIQKVMVQLIMAIPEPSSDCG